MEVFKTTTIKLKDKVREKLSDKYAKLRQNDVGTFSKLFQVVALSSINANVHLPPLRPSRSTTSPSPASNSSRPSRSTPSCSTTRRSRSPRSPRC